MPASRTSTNGQSKVEENATDKPISHSGLNLMPTPAETPSGSGSQGTAVSPTPSASFGERPLATGSFKVVAMMGDRPIGAGILKIVEITSDNRPITAGVFKIASMNENRPVGANPFKIASTFQNRPVEATTWKIAHSILDNRPVEVSPIKFS
ncbi:MAG: hypothetical protein NW237_17700 [Cyanobacteriota bacterium]|nr:hypothetical protein [Cyanobacteriota bacterium]